MPVLDPVIATLIANTDEFTAKMDEAKAQMAELGASAETSTGELDAMGASTGLSGIKSDAADAAGAVGGVGVAARSASDDVAGAAGIAAESVGGIGIAASTASDTVAGAASDIGGAIGGVGIAATGARDDVAVAAAGIGGSLGGVSTVAEKTGADVEKIGTKAEKVGSSAEKSSGGIKKMLGNMGVPNALLGGWGALGAGIVGTGALALHFGDQMQSANAAIAVAAGESIKNATAIGNAFLDTAGKSEFSGKEMAQAYAGVAGQLESVQGSVLTTAQATQVMNAAADLATAKQISLSDATSTVAKTLQAFSMGAKDAAGVSNILFNASNATGQGVDSLSSAMIRAKTRIGAMAPPIGDLAGLMVDLTNHGESGRQAMSALTTTFTALLKPASEAQKTQIAMNVTLQNLPPSLRALAAEYQKGTMSTTAVTDATKGLSVENTVLWGKFKSSADAAKVSNEAYQKLGITVLNSKGQFIGMSSIIGQLHDKIAGMSTAQATAELTALGLGSGAGKLVTTIQSGAGAYDKAVASVTKMGSAQRGAAIQSQTLSVEFKTMKATADDLLTSLGEKLIPVLGKLLGVVEKVVQGFIKDWPQISAAIKSVWKDVEPALDLLWKGISKVFTFLVDHKPLLIAALVAIAAAFFPVTTAVLALAAGATLILKHWSAIEDFFKRIGHDIAAPFEDAWHAIDNDFIQPIERAFDAVVGWIKKHWELLAEILLAPISPALALFIMFHKQIIHFFEDIVEWVSSHFGDILPDIKRVVDGIVDFFTALPGRISSAFGNVVSTIWGALKSSASWINANVLTPVVSFFTGLPGRILSGLGDIASIIWGGLKTSATWVDTNVIAPVVNFFTALPGRIVSGMGNIVSTIWGALETSGTWIETHVLDPIVNFFKALPGRIISALGDIGSKIWHEIISHIPGGGAIAGAAGLAGGVVHGLENFLHVAGGGLVTRPSFALIGESGPELVLNPQQTQQAMARGNITTGIPSVLSRASAGGGNVTFGDIHIEINSNQDPRQIALMVQTDILQLMRSRGNAWGQFASGWT
jgi:TP901 family phage tail tape measure protein